MYDGNGEQAGREQFKKLRLGFKGGPDMSTLRVIDLDTGVALDNIVSVDIHLDGNDLPSCKVAVVGGMVVDSYSPEGDLDVDLTIFSEVERETQFRAGDTVALKGYYTPMTVAGSRTLSDGREVVLCNWFFEGHLNKDEYFATDIRPVVVAKERIKP